MTRSIAPSLKRLLIVLLLFFLALTLEAQTETFTTTATRTSSPTGTATSTSTATGTATTTSTPTASVSFINAVAPGGVVVLQPTPDVLTYTLSYSNTGSLNLTNVRIWDTLFTGSCYVDNSANPVTTTSSIIKPYGQFSLLAWLIPTLAVGESGAITFQAVIQDRVCDIKVREVDFPFFLAYYLVVI